MEILVQPIGQEEDRKWKAHFWLYALAGAFSRDRPGHRVDRQPD